MFQVLRQMRKLPWQDPDLKGYLICCMVNIWNVKYNSIHCVANLLAGLVAYQEDVGIHVVDGVLEDIRLGMEVLCDYFYSLFQRYWNNEADLFISALD